MRIEVIERVECISHDLLERLHHETRAEFLAHRRRALEHHCTAKSKELINSVLLRRKFEEDEVISSDNHRDKTTKIRVSHWYRCDPDQTEQQP